MKQSKQTVVMITGLSHDGRGIAHQDGKTIFITGGLVGEEVVITYQKRRNRFDEASVTAVLKPASTRREPACPSFAVCGGCSLQHMDTRLQIAHKETVLLEQLRHIGKVTPQSILPATVASSYGYRRKARLGVRYVIKKDKLVVGFREKNGRYLADIESCAVLHPSVGEHITTLQQFLWTLQNYLHIPQLEIAISDDTTAIIVRHLAPFSAQDLALIRQFASQQNYHIYLQPGGPATVALFYPDTQARLRYRLEDYTIEMLFHPTDFTQVNAEINNKLVRLAMELLVPKPDDILLDLFCGIGNFTLPLARFARKVTGVEGSQEMVARGYENAAHNGISNVSFQCQNLTCADHNWMDANYSGILLDPPRAGAWEVVQYLPTIAASRVVYVSCNPATLARDAGWLCKNGFELSAVGVLDMFPHTSHVESIALFSRIRHA